MKGPERIEVLIAIRLMAGAMLVCLTGQACQRFEPEGFLNVNTGAVSTITPTSALAGGEVTDDGGSPVTARGVCWGTYTEPTIQGSRTTDGSGSGSFASTMTGLTASTTYYMRAYATNSTGTTYGEEKIFNTTDAGITVSDFDGNVYQTVQIGSQIWMAENLKTTHYANGSAITLVEGTGEWDALGANEKAYCWYGNSISNRDLYGGLYTWAAAMNGAAGSTANPSGIQGVCPDGWHLPSDAEWQELEMFLGMSQVDADALDWRGTDEGGNLKESGTSHWTSPNTGATNESGFTALPGGSRTEDGSFQTIGDAACFWAATGDDPDRATGRLLDHTRAEIYRAGFFKEQGFSVRCVQGDVTVDLPSVITASISDITSGSALGGGEVTGDGGAEVTARGVCWSTSPTPTISDDTTLNGTGTGTFVSSLTRLAPLTKYYVRAYATNSAGTSYGDEVSFTTSTAVGAPVSDIDGNEYQTIYIGEQLWMAENLKTTRYADGSGIPLVEGNSEWDALVAADKAYCWYDNDTAHRDTFGGMYTWAAAMNGAPGSDASPSGVQGVCPSGWHLPSDEEWKELEIYLGMSREDADKEGSRGADEGGRLKETGTSHWKDPNAGATDDVGFTALPGGYRNIGGSFSYMGDYASFWTSTEGDASNAWGRYLGYDYTAVFRDTYYMDYGFSVRCVKD
jgi:uncharacterized protein (TIGR02145 family)